MNGERERADALARAVAREYGVGLEAVRVARAPYRICPLGAHIDHQLGCVTAMAIDRSVLLAFAPSGSREVRLRSRDFPGAVEFTLDAVPEKQAGDWGNYPRGAAWALLQRGHRLEQGINGVIEGELHGGGVSSSAAVGVAYLLALEHANGLEVDAGENIALDQAIENEYLGLSNGILDQSAILLSRRGHLTLIDCATASHDLLPAARSLPAYRIMLVFSGVRRALVGTDYNRRVEECAEAARRLLKATGRGQDQPVLRNVSAEEYAAFGHLLEGPSARRAAHYFGEVERVRRGVLAWNAADLREFGRLMSESGASSIENYECGSPPLVDLYEILVGTEGVLGARFSGAGFRGCCVALVESEAVDQAAEEVRAAYTRRHPELAEDAQVVVCQSADGAGVMEE